MFKTLLMLLAMAAPVYADHTGKPYKSVSQVLVPPPQFNNQMGARYKGIFKRVLTTHAEVQRICGGDYFLACAKFPKGRPASGPAKACTIYIPNNLPPDLLRAVNTHEVGHCMGWRHTAPE